MLATIVDNQIVEAEAKKRRISPPDLVKAELADDNISEPTDGDLRRFWEENKGPASMSFEQASPQIRQLLRQQQRGLLYQHFIETLRREYKVEILFDALRTSIQSEGFPAKGPAEAPVTIVEFADFECPYCAQIFPVLKKIEANYGQNVRLIFRQFPLSIHSHAQKASEASLCAYDQGKFWELHDAMFQDNRNLEIDQLKHKASALQLDMSAFNNCLETKKKGDTIQTDIREGFMAGVEATPTLFINGRFLAGAQSYTVLARFIDDELRRKGIH
jgi:predicted DsbA family dithiol-disulfide isomerase